MKRFLIARLSSLGDVVCSLPAASALKASFPDSEIVWVCDPRFAAIVERCKSVDKVIRTGVGPNPKTWLVSPGRFDVALDLQGLLKSGLIVLGSRAKEKLGYHWQREGSSLFSRRVLPDPTSFHVVDQYVDVARAAGGNGDRAEFALNPWDEDVKSIRAKIETEKIVTINAGAGWVTKRWPSEHVASLCDGLHENGVTAVLIGGNAQTDMETADAAIKLCKNPPVNLVGQTNLGELIAVIAQSAAHVAGDTGSVHISAALGTPAIGLYSITRPQRSCPYGQIERCHYDSESLANIKPESVLKTVLEAIG